MIYEVPRGKVHIGRTRIALVRISVVAYSCRESPLPS
jgi:hypothetical protein